MDATRPVLELRVALTAKEYERLYDFYVEGLGVPAQNLSSRDANRAVILEMGQATLELFDEGHAATVDAIEVGRRVSGAVRLAVRVQDLDAALERATRRGATLINRPVVTPWGHRNARLLAPDGMQVTLFEAAHAPQS